MIFLKTTFTSRHRFKTWLLKKYTDLCISWFENKVYPFSQQNITRVTSKQAFSPINNQYFNQIENSQSIYFATQLPDFYMMRTFVIKSLILINFFHFFWYLKKLGAKGHGYHDNDQGTYSNNVLRQIGH